MQTEERLVADGGVGQAHSTATALVSSQLNQKQLRKRRRRVPRALMGYLWQYTSKMPTIRQSTWSCYSYRLRKTPTSQLYGEGSSSLQNYKLGDKNSAKKYWLVALIDNEAKYFTVTILEELTAWATATNIILINQTCFRKNVGTITNIMALPLLVDGAVCAKSPLHFCFIDFQAAFDHTNHGMLWRKQKIPPTLVRTPGCK
ncbi:hypothetical protein NDU88_003924 [Pleurodeles waltl]|uniref:Reverse transcriptase domain-containing protein n=1 Tax=Pleurodeles waltl TaxID=8319 RepID=A0AAV7KYT5_PLEWA|nr:hypothetical protein NDU88_003924 [Pleurodeles waltl]